MEKYKEGKDLCEKDKARVLRFVHENFPYIYHKVYEELYGDELTPYTEEESKLVDEIRRYYLNTCDLHIAVMSKSQESWWSIVTYKHQNTIDGIGRGDGSFYESAIINGLITILIDLNYDH